jgi:hypothetical protein
MRKQNKSLILVVLAAVLAWIVAGCASYRTIQEDTSYDEAGNPIRKITTTVKVGTFCDSNSALATSKATNTDKSQSSELGGLSQSTSASNIVLVLQAIQGIVSSVK